MYDESSEGGVATLPVETATAEITDAPVLVGDTAVDTQPDVTTTSTEEVEDVATEVMAEPSLHEKIKETYGVDLSGKYADDDELLKGLVHAQGLIGKRDEYAELGKQYAPYVPQFNDYLQSLQQPEAQPEEAPASWWNPPVWDKQNERYFSANSDTSQIEAVENTPLEIQQQWNEYLNYHQNWSHRLQTNPVDALAPFRQELKEEILQESRSERQRDNQLAHQQTDAHSIVSRNEEWLYEKNKEGHFVNDQNGQRIYTPAGSSYVRNVARLVNAGMIDQGEINQTAVQLTRAEFLGQPKQTTPVLASQAPGSPQVPPPGQAAPPKSQKGMSLRDKLLSASAGIPDEEFELVE
jgi:hypothetical protein